MLSGVGTIEAIGTPVVRARRVAAVVTADHHLDLRQEARQGPDGRRLGGALFATDQDAAEAWSDWAATVPSGSWTVQIAAVIAATEIPAAMIQPIINHPRRFRFVPAAAQTGV